MGTRKQRSSVRRQGAKARSKASGVSGRMKPLPMPPIDSSYSGCTTPQTEVAHSLSPRSRPRITTQFVYPKSPDDRTRFVLPSISSQFSHSRDVSSLAISEKEDAPHWLHDLKVVWNDEMSKVIDPEQQSWFLEVQEQIFKDQEAMERDQEQETSPLEAGQVMRLDRNSVMAMEEEEVLMSESESFSTPKSTRSGTMKRLLNKFRRSSSQPLDLKKDLLQLQGMRSQLEKTIVRIGKQVQRIKSKLEVDTTKWATWADESLLSTGTTYYTTKLLLLNTQLEIEAYKAKQVSEQTEILKESMRVNRSKCTLPLKAQAILKNGVQLPQKYVTLEESCAEMEIVLDDLNTRFMQMQKEAQKPLRRMERVHKLGSILIKAAHDSLGEAFRPSYYHSMDRIVQAEFSKLMLDERQAEGRAFKNWLNLVHTEGREGVGPKGILDFCRKFTSYIMHNADLDPMSNVFALNLYNDADSPGMELEEEVLLYQPLTLFVDRLVYPYIIDILDSFKGPLVDERDSRFRKKQQWMTCLTQDEIGIHPAIQKEMTTESQMDAGAMRYHINDSSYTKNQSQDELTWVFRDDQLVGFPYEAAIRRLSQLDSEGDMVPRNILRILAETVHLITQDAQYYSTQSNFVINADTLFPLVVWVLVHSKLNRIHHLMSHVKRFLGEELNYGLSSYYFIQIDAALEFIDAQTPETFSFAPTLEQDIASPKFSEIVRSSHIYIPH